MTRIARKRSCTGIYHIMLRGINKQNIFETEHDYYQFVTILNDVKTRVQEDGTVATDGCTFYAWVCMSNHVHLLIKEGTKTIGEVVKSIASSYVYYFNHRYGRIGHLFQDRFKSEPCEDDDYFFTLFRYINQNPLKAGITTDIINYNWCSWTYDYVRRHNDTTQETVCDVDAVMEMISFEGLKELIEEMCLEKTEDFRSNEKNNSDESIRRLLFEFSGCSTTVDFQKARFGSLGKAFKEAIKRDATQEQISRITGLTRYRIRKEIR